MVYRDVCANCNTGSAFEDVHDHVIWPEAGYSFASIEEKYGTYFKIRVRQCTHCAKTSAWLEEHKRGEHMVSRVASHLVVPASTPRMLEESVPSPIRSLFAEASVCEQAGALRGAAALYRAAAEALCTDQKATGNTLYAKLDSLKKSKEIAEQIIEDLHEARMLGNDSIHDGLTYTSEEVSDVADLLEEATVALYVQPAERRRLREARRTRREAARQALSESDE